MAVENFPERTIGFIREISRPLNVEVIVCERGKGGGNTPPFSMTCYLPIPAWRSVSDWTAKGKRAVVFRADQGIPHTRFEVPCNKCIGCKLEYSRQWAVRCMHEASLYDENCFLTLTYRSEDLLYPSGNVGMATSAKDELPTLYPNHLRQLWKDLRKEYKGVRFRYFACGEYGGRKGRPHYHACIFGLDFGDKKQCGTSKGYPIYSSPTLDRVWGRGNGFVGDLTFDSAAYVARYVTKKVDTSSEFAPTRLGLHPEFMRSSNGGGNRQTPLGGIGKRWLHKFQSDVFPSDEVIVNGRPGRPPRFYVQELERQAYSLLPQYRHFHPYEFEAMKAKRLEEMEKLRLDTSPQRLRIREAVKSAQIRSLRRNQVD